MVVHATNPHVVRAGSGLPVGRFLGMLGVAFAYLLILTTVFGIVTRASLQDVTGRGNGIGESGSADWEGATEFGNPLHTLSLLLPLIAITLLLLLLLSSVPVTRWRLVGWALVTGSVATIVSAVLNLVGLTVAGFRNMDVVLPSAIMVAVFGFYYVFTTVAVLVADLTVRASVRRIPRTPSPTSVN
ncbi:hypothetical protein [Planctomonas psychrotolerans]|uniref:hypothetical protein n=1 Tax=Planctomonas psychrotolerans TaxID=2528712 RepID=UPI001239B494|nr:hypothetical protein [Planctomonas psychrotolerans]